MTEKPVKSKIVKLLKEKACLKQDIFDLTQKIFSDFREILRGVSIEYAGEITKKDKRVIVEFRDKGPHQCELRVGGDLLIFYMHTNVFEFDRSHAMWKTGYVQEDETRSYCGMIMIYNFLHDSFKYNRPADIGYLIGRVFINKDRHFFVDGKKHLGFVHNDFIHEKLGTKEIRSVVDHAILYALEFDLYTPPYDTLKEISVGEIQEAGSNMQIRTGKRLGFRFSSDPPETGE